MKIKINKPFALNEIGKRDNNQDCIFPQKGMADENSWFFVVCDGMGGYEGGEIASAAVCRGFDLFLSENDSEIFDENIFQRALSFAYEQLNRASESENVEERMGTTLTFLCFYREGAFMAHIGDSRIYHLRKEGETMKILYKSKDHSFVNELLESGMITEEEAARHPQRNIITRAMQPFRENKGKADVYKTSDIKAGDYFFLCTDGILEQIDDEKLCSILKTDTGLEEKNNMILKICEGETKDNFSSYLVSVKEIAAS